ncbi:MAG: hypothetical protein QOI92_1247, partial [Chloroflexota bacterium]|nr:hypothetical protein [Chloroflexota bacterium]
MPRRLMAFLTPVLATLPCVCTQSRPSQASHPIEGKSMKGTGKRFVGML